MLDLELARQERVTMAAMNVPASAPSTTRRSGPFSLSPFNVADCNDGRVPDTGPRRASYRLEVRLRAALIPRQMTSETITPQPTPITAESHAERGVHPS